MFRPHMKDSPQSGKSGDGQDEEILYEEIVRPPFPPSGAQRPPFGRFAPPPPGYVIEEEIIEEVEEYPESPGDDPAAGASEADAAPVPPPAQPAMRPAANPPKPRPFVKTANFRRAAPEKARPDDRRPGASNAPKYFRLAAAAAVFAALCVGIFYAFKGNPYAASILSSEAAAARPRESAGMILRFSSGEMTEAAKRFYSKLSNPLTLENLRDIIVTGSINMLDGGQPKNFYCIKRYDSGAFLKIGSGDDEKAYLLPGGGGAFLLEEGRTGGRRTALDPEKAALLRALTEWDDAIFLSAFSADIPDGRGKPEFKFLGSREFLGKKAEAAEAAFENGDRTTFFFDGESGLLSGISFPAGASEMEVAFSDYGDADGVYKFPMARAVFFKGKKIAELDVSFASVNRGLFFPM